MTHELKKNNIMDSISIYRIISEANDYVQRQMIHLVQFSYDTKMFDWSLQAS